MWQQQNKKKMFSPQFSPFFFYSFVCVCVDVFFLFSCCHESYSFTLKDFYVYVRPRKLELLVLLKKKNWKIFFKIFFQSFFFFLHDRPKETQFFFECLFLIFFLGSFFFFSAVLKLKEVELLCSTTTTAVATAAA